MCNRLGRARPYSVVTRVAEFFHRLDGRLRLPTGGAHGNPSLAFRFGANDRVIRSKSTAAGWAFPRFARQLTPFRKSMAGLGRDRVWTVLGPGSLPGPALGNLSSADRGVLRSGIVESGISPSLRSRSNAQDEIGREAFRALDRASSSIRRTAVCLGHADASWP